MKIIVEMDDTLDDILGYIYHDTKNCLKTYLDKSAPDNGTKPDVPDFHGDLDYDGSIHSIIDSAIPPSKKEIKDLWYLYEEDFEKAYQDAGIGEKSEENWKLWAIYSYLEQRLYQWYEENSKELVAEYYRKSQNKKIVKALENSEKIKSPNLNDELI